MACSYSDCSLGAGRGEASIPAHLLQHHLRFECDSAARKQRFLLVERARRRVLYPRPWGITVPLTSSPSPPEDGVRNGAADNSDGWPMGSTTASPQEEAAHVLIRDEGEREESNLDEEKTFELESDNQS